MMRWLLLVGLFAAFSSVAAEPAQKKMYRCGNVFQERPCEGPKAAPAAAEAPKQGGPSQSTLESRKQIRCENFGRQVTELVNREKSEKNADLLNGWQSQRKVLEDRMRSDNC